MAEVAGCLRGGQTRARRQFLSLGRADPVSGGRERGGAVAEPEAVPPLRLDQQYLFTRLSTRPGLALVPAGRAIVDNHIWRSRASYQFTRKWSLRAILDYAAVLPDLSLIDLEREKRFTADTLVTYLVNPWTALYAGYTDGYGNVEIDPVSPDRLRPTDSAFHPTGRQVFIKLSYLLRF